MSTLVGYVTIDRKTHATSITCDHAGRYVITVNDRPDITLLGNLIRESNDQLYREMIITGSTYVLKRPVFISVWARHHGVVPTKPSTLPKSWWTRFLDWISE